MGRSLETGKLLCSLLLLDRVSLVMYSMFYMQSLYIFELRVCCLAYFCVYLCVFVSLC